MRCRSWPPKRPRHLRISQCMPPRHSLTHQHAAEAHAIAAIAIWIMRAVRGQQRLRAGAFPRATAEHPPVRARTKEVLAPLPKVSAQIMDAKGIRLGGSCLELSAGKPVMIVRDEVFGEIVLRLPTAKIPRTLRWRPCTAPGENTFQLVRFGLRRGLGIFEMTNACGAAPLMIGGQAVTLTSREKALFSFEPREPIAKGHCLLPTHIRGRQCRFCSRRRRETLEKRQMTSLCLLTAEQHFPLAHWHLGKTHAKAVGERWRLGTKRRGASADRHPSEAGQQVRRAGGHKE